MAILQNLTSLTPNLNESNTMTYRRRDHIAHFILRLVFCQQESHQKWFTTQEVHYFKLKLMSLKDANIHQRISINNLNITLVNIQNIISLQTQLHSCIIKLI